MKKLVLSLLVLIAGGAVGGGAAYGVNAWAPAKPAKAEAQAETTAFVPAGKILAPLVFPDGRLSGYVSFEVQLEVAAAEAETVRQRMPLLLHAVNLRTYRTPMASGPDGMLPNIEVFRTVIMESAPTAFGPNVVRRAAITQAAPA